MNKIYLRLKRNISVQVYDGDWALYTGDMIVLQKIGIRSEIIKTQYTPINKDSYLLIGFEYSKIIDISKADVEYHMVWHECNSVDTLIRISTGSPLYQNRTCTYSEILSNNKLNITIVDNLKFDDVFEDVSIQYNREDKLKEILQ
jgi:hypothetical protein